MAEVESDDQGVSGLVAVVADCGSHSCRAGMSSDDAPRVNFETVVGTAADKKEHVVGSGAQARREALALRRAYRNKLAVSWDDVERVWEHMFNELDVHPNEHPVLLAEPHLVPKLHKERMAQLLFERFSVPALLTQSQAVLALFSTGGTHGVVVDSSESATHVVPVWDGYPLNTALVHVSGGGGALTSLWREQLLAGAKDAAALEALARDGHALEQLKHKHCFVAGSASEYDALGGGADRAASTHRLPDGTSVALGRRACAAVGEALFRPAAVEPTLAGVAGAGAAGALRALRQQCGLPLAAMRAVLNCEVAIRPSLYKNVVLCGGNCQTAGFLKRFEAEMAAITPSVHAVGLHATQVELACTLEPGAGGAVWRGGALLGAMPTFEKLCVAKADYDESGPSIINRKTF